MLTKPLPSSIPDAPGSYQFVDRDGRIIYVGKAISLRQRVSSYFQDPSRLAPRIQQMLSLAEKVEWVQVRNEVEALVLEYNLIKLHKPRFNIRLRDDKSYPYVAVSVSEPWPRVAVVRTAHRRGVRYFGPYTHVKAVREMLAGLLRPFPVRTCTDAKFVRHSRDGRPCLLYHIERCSGPCINAVSKERYQDILSQLMEFLSGRGKEVSKQMEKEMRAAADALQFEIAAKIRDRIEAAKVALQDQQMVMEKPYDADVVGIHHDALEAGVFVLYVRNGRVVGRDGFVLDKLGDTDTASVIGYVLERLYADPILGVPKEVLVPELPDEQDLYEHWLSGLRRSSCKVIVPKRGFKRQLLLTAAQNAVEELSRAKYKRAVDPLSRHKALVELQEALGLAVFPLRIECYDMSHLQGSDYVGSMVVMEDGLLKKSDYRHFRIRGVPSNDDYAAMEEVLNRRVIRLLRERDRPPEKPKRFAYPPHLILLDGGKGQLGVGRKVLENFGLAEEIAVAALAKRFEEVYVVGRDDPLPIPRESEALYLLQQVRDEAHRFAISYHRKLRSKRMLQGGSTGFANPPIEIPPQTPVQAHVAGRAAKEEFHDQ
ncbi:MAG: excinuclease ABC subunit UvrC [Actinobacteria bacterium]|nr:excinuclease ABC subunit UvrC [Actinomycetota bacterium]MCL6094537.1 excinuclease ABC subunit UvrC [Actinomycetota bacterium]